MALDVQDLFDYFTAETFNQEQDAFEARVSRAVSKAAQKAPDSVDAQFQWAMYLLYDQQVQALRTALSKIHVENRADITRSELKAQIESSERARDAALQKFEALVAVVGVVQGTRSAVMEVEF